MAPSLKDFVTYLQQKACYKSDEKCIKDTASLLDAAHLDLDYDANSHSLTVNAFWDSKSSVTETLSKRDAAETVEVGVLNIEAASEPEEQSLGGFLTVLGQDDDASTTLQFRIAAPTR